MNARFVAVLVVLLVVLGGAALIYQRQQSAQQASNAALLGQPLLKGFKAADAAALRLTEPKGVLTLHGKDGGWTIAERADFPADFAKVRDFTLKAVGLKVAQSEPIGEADRARLMLNEPGRDGAGTLVEFLAADGKPLARLIVGKKYFRGGSGDARGGAADGRFVMRPEEPTTVFIVADPLVQASAKSADWIDRSSFVAEHVKTLEVRFPGDGGWRIERAADDANWKLAGAKADEKLDVARANAASYALGVLELADVAAPGTKDSGLDKPVVVDATTLEGLSYAIRIGRPEGDNYYLSFKSGGALVKQRKPEKGEKAEDRARRDKDYADRVQRIEARLPRERVLSGYVLRVPKSKLEDVLRQRSELLEKKPAKK
jgi:hypothetical protein